MGKETSISWTDATFNPWMGCVKVSDGCKFCYAEAFTKSRMGKNLWGADAERQVTKGPWKEVVKWNVEARRTGVRKRVFCASLCDVFEDHPTANATREALWGLIRRCEMLDWQLLTKRPENFARFLPDDWGDGYPHVWLGVSVEDMRVAHRVSILAQTPAHIRFISYEPALGPLWEIPFLEFLKMDWVIYGGESGSNRRPEDKAWARTMRDRCKENGVAFFHKQSSAFKPGQGVELDGEIIQEFPDTLLRAAK